jgi:hypothetical protein
MDKLEFHINNLFLGVTYNAAVIATSKSLTQNVLRRRSKEGDDSNTGIFATHAVHLRSALDCDRLPERYSYFKFCIPD